MATAKIISKTSLSLFLLVLLVGMCLLNVTGCATTCPVSPTKDIVSSPMNIKSMRENDKTAHTLPCNQSATFTCQPLRLTDLTFLPNETLLSINCGDSARWLFQTMISDTDTTPLTHLLIKPKEDNIKTNLIIATNQRTYYLTLISDENKTHNAHFVFYDPTPCLPLIHSQPRLDNHYQFMLRFFQTVPVWLPTHIYNDGKSVYIKMPADPLQTAPILYLLDEHNHSSIVNYQLINHTYRVDQLFTKALLVNGFGRDRETVIIEYVGTRSRGLKTK